jgi:ankyrin repeat protein
MGTVSILAPARAQTADDIFRAIRADNLDVLRSLPSASVNLHDGLDSTPLHYAALYGSPAAVRLLLDRGADPNARNKSENTPLIYAAYQLAKTQLLVAKGAQVNASGKDGITPLMVAASTHGNTETVRYLLDKAADVKAVTTTGEDALQKAAEKGDPGMLRLLLADPERVHLLLAAGSNVNAVNTFAGAVKNGPIALVHLTPLQLASPAADPSTIRELLASGARVNEADIRMITPLMLAVATDEPKLENIRHLIAAKADVNAKDKNGETVLDWALKEGNPQVIAMLKAAGAMPGVTYVAPQRPAGFAPGTAADAIARSAPLLAKSGEVFFIQGGGCVGCHHQPMNAQAFAAMRAANLNPDERLRRVFLDGMTAIRPRTLSTLPVLTAGGGDFHPHLVQTEALIALGEPASPTTDAIVHYLAARQDPSGAWTIDEGPRPPMESSNISRTAMAIHALKVYGWPARRAEFDDRIARAQKWLMNAHPVTSYEQADRIMGLQVAGAPPEEITKSTLALLKEQHPDGGWSQNPHLESDAYATGTVLSTLYRAKLIKATDPAYAQGVAYLLKTQFPDGSWYVRSRAPKLQPYFQSGFPHDHDQWISNAATAAAVMALAPAAR